MADSFLNTDFSMIFIQNGTIYAPDAVIENGTLVVANGRIQTIAPTREIAPPPDAQVIDAAGMSVVPGFIDLQLNGGFGHDFTAAPETIWVVAEQLPQFGVTSFLPTIITSPQETVAAAQAVIAQGPPAAFGGAVPLGLHLEGPFLNPLKKGAHEVRWMKRPFLPDRQLDTRQWRAVGDAGSGVAQCARHDSDIGGTWRGGQRRTFDGCVWRSDGGV